MDKIIILISIGIIAVISVINYIKRIKSGSCCSGEGILNAEKVKVKEIGTTVLEYIIAEINNNINIILFFILISLFSILNLDE